jgi:hypothetical protein
MRTGCRRWTTLVAVLVGVVGLALAGAAEGYVQSVSVDANGLDNIGDSGGAPDVGKVQASVLPNGSATRESMIVGTWLDHNTMAVGEHVSWLLDFGSGLADGPSGFDYLLELEHHPGYPEQWNLYTWINGQWQPSPSSWVTLAKQPGGRVYFRMNLSVPDQRATISMRVYTGSTITGGSDIAPDLVAPRLIIPLSPHGAQDPLLGCTFAGGCVAPANSLDPYGAAGGGNQLANGNVSSSCNLGTQNLRSIDRQVSQVQSKLRHTRSAGTRRRLNSQLRSLRARRARQASSTAHLCG